MLWQSPSSGDLKPVDGFPFPCHWSHSKTSSPPRPHLSSTLGLPSSCLPYVIFHFCLPIFAHRIPMFSSPTKNSTVLKKKNRNNSGHYVLIKVLPDGLHLWVGGGQGARSGRHSPACAVWKMILKHFIHRNKCVRKGLFTSSTGPRLSFFLTPPLPSSFCL